MEPQEANKIIAEYMGVSLETFLTYNLKSYSKSLDAIVPVWEKLEIRMSLDMNYRDMSPWACVCVYEIAAFGETIQEAAAIATAKAILEITEQKESE